MLLSPVPQKFNTFNTFNTFATFHNYHQLSSGLESCIHITCHQ
jgi:hypothetical protein